MPDYKTFEAGGDIVLSEIPTPMIEPDKYCGLVDYSGNWISFAFLSYREKGFGAGAREILMHPFVRIPLPLAREFLHWLDTKVEEAEQNQSANTGQTKPF